MVIQFANQCPNTKRIYLHPLTKSTIRTHLKHTPQIQVNTQKRALFLHPVCFYYNSE